MIKDCGNCGAPVCDGTCDVLCQKCGTDFETWECNVGSSLPMFLCRKCKRQWGYKLWDYEHPLYRLHNGENIPDRRLARKCANRAFSKSFREKHDLDTLLDEMCAFGYNVERVIGRGYIVMMSKGKMENLERMQL